MRTPALKIDDLQKRYETGVEALRGVSFEIGEGEFYGLLGPNGAGKSTLIHCTTGLAQPTGGTIEVFGHDAIHDYDEARQAVGLAPQEPNIDWFLTVAETLDYHAGYFGMPKQERRERTEELLDVEGLHAGPTLTSGRRGLLQRRQNRQGMRRPSTNQTTLCQPVIEVVILLT